MASNDNALTYDSLVRISRVNGRDASGQLMSDVQQAKANARLIQDQGAKVGMVVEALNVSGGDVYESDQWQQAIARVRSGKSAGVAFAYTDRLARETVGGVSFLDDVIRAGGTVLLPGRVLDSSMTPGDRFAFIVEMAAGELQLNTYKQRARVTRDALRERGVMASMPYGYMRNRQADGSLVDSERDAKALVLDPDTAPVVALVFQLRASGKSWGDVRNQLEADGIPSPKGGPIWPTSSLTGLVRRIAYRGDMTSGDVLLRDTHPAIVSRDLWQRAQPKGLVKLNRSTTPGVATGLVVCEACGHPMRLSNNGAGVASYQCRRDFSEGRCTAPASGIQAPVDAAVDARLRELADGAIDVQAVVVARELADARNALQVAEEDLEAFLEGSAGLSGRVLADHLGKLQARIDAAQVRVDQAEQSATVAAVFPTTAADWDALDAQGKRLAARAVIERVTLARHNGRSTKASNPVDRLIIHWR